jgi:hypothetical protein
MAMRTLVLLTTFAVGCQSITYREYLDSNPDFSVAARMKDRECWDHCNGSARCIAHCPHVTVEVGRCEDLGEAADCVEQDRHELRVGPAVEVLAEGLGITLAGLAILAAGVASLLHKGHCATDPSACPP